MAYTKQTWVDGTTPIDAEHMNHIEDGIADIKLTRPIYVVTNNGERKLSWKSGSFEPVLFGDLFQNAWSNGISYSVINGIMYVESIIKLSSFLNGEPANTVYTSSMKFVENTNNELVLQE